ncbi:MAG: PQQ-dependent sugar dehydrogenase [Acidobacteriota bacterium]
MKTLRWMVLGGSVLLSAALLLQAAKTDKWTVLTGDAAAADSKSLVPGTSRKITSDKLPAGAKATPGSQKAVPRGSAMPKAPAGFKVEIFADTGALKPRQIRIAPNNDMFVVNATNGSVSVYRGMTADGKPMTTETFVSGLTRPFGINFYPADNPTWVYVSTDTSVFRYAYKKGDLKASGAAETIIKDLAPAGNHFTRDIVFSKDGKSLYVAVGSADNVSDTRPVQDRRAAILEYTPDGTYVGIFASGIRNPVGLAINPTTGELWTSINERDNLGDNLVPDYVTHVQKGGFYGWPWFYIGPHPDDRAKMVKPAEITAAKVIVPDVLLQAHSASLGMAFYTGTKFPAEYRGDAFAAEHGSWNRSVKAGHEVVRIPLENGKANGVYQDFLTGFVNENDQPWGQPVGIATAPDGSLLVTDDLASIIWRVSYVGNAK